MTASAIAKFLSNPDRSAYPHSAPATVKVSPRAFGLRCVGDSMTKPEDPRSIPDGCTVVVDPDRQWQDGDRVVVSKRGFDVVTVKEIHRDGTRIFLRPLNPACSLMEFTDEMTVLGVVVQTIIDEEDGQP
jgi:SOS-response transcriptional repressor LexA